MDDITVVVCWVAREEDADEMRAQISKSAVSEPELVCRDWWKTRGGRIRKASIDDVRQKNKYERFISNDPI